MTPCSSIEVKRELLKKFDPTRETWVVSNLQSKWHLQKTILHERSVLERDAVLRATELWKQMTFQMREFQTLSPELAQTLIWNWLEPKSLPWARTPQSVTTVMKQMQMWVPVFAHAGFQSVMSEWFGDHPEAVEKWGHWYVLCSELWEWLKARHLMVEAWLPGLLLNEDLSTVRWPKKLIFDLGPQISLVEGQLIQQLSRSLDVEVLYPEAPWAALMPETLQPYELLLEKSLKLDNDWQPSRFESAHFGRFSTQLAEVKDTVARVRGWLDQGVEPSQIALMAPDIEEYWPALRLYFEREGIPVNKAVATKLGSFVEMSRWLASLRLSMARVRSTDLETLLFSSTDHPRLSVQEFRRLFTNVYDEQDLKRAEHLFSNQAPLPNTQELSVQDFLTWALGAWSADAATDRLEHLLNTISQEVPLDLTLPLREWLSYVEGLLARREWPVREANESGVTCVSLSSAHWLSASHAVVLNLHENALRSMERSPVSLSDRQKIFQDTGLILGAIERQQLEFELVWLWQRAWQELCLNYSGTDFQGKVLTPSRMWMWAAFINEQFIKDPQAPAPTRWDEIQHLPLNNWIVQGFANNQGDDLQLALNRDVTNSPGTWQKSEQVAFSASSLKRFWDCPFMFGIEKRMRLRDDPALDLDLDHLSRGKLLHAVLDRLTADPMKFDYSDEELANLIDECQQADRVEVGDIRLWPAVRNQHVRLCKVFLDMEKQWRQQFPQTRTVGRESKVAGYWDLERHEPTQTPTNIQFSGRIDRVDSDDEGRYALIDYKASSTNKNWEAWLKQKDLQLAFYSLLLESGHTELAPGEVMAANFYVVKDRVRNKGYFQKTESAELYNPIESRRNYITQEQKAELFQNVKEEIQTALEKIVAGDLNPHPADKKNCERCPWRKPCRAPHLN